MQTRWHGASLLSSYPLAFMPDILFTGFASLSIALIALLILLGAAVGFAAGLLGIGGGMLLVPFLTLIFAGEDFPQEHIVHIAIATSLTTILFTSLSSVRAHHARGAVLWKVAKMLAPGILLGSVAGAQVAGAIKTSWLALAFALFVGFSATQMLVDRKPKPTREMPAWAGMLGAGTLIGVVSSFVGAGGGFISVPFMTWCNVRIHNAVATSAALGFPIALAGSLGYVLAGLHVSGLPGGNIGFINLPALLCIVSSSVLLAPLGARTAHNMDVKSLKRAFAFLLYILAAYMLYKGIST
jgi:uncharacterized membrane protein YfcA